MNYQYNKPNTTYFPHAQLTTNVINQDEQIIVQMVISKISEPEPNIALEQYLDINMPHQEFANKVLGMYNTLNEIFIRQQK